MQELLKGAQVAFVVAAISGVCTVDLGRWGGLDDEGCLPKLPLTRGKVCAGQRLVRRRLPCAF